ncbi:MAG: 1-aminocyclopropane-1-carboxylate deaminase/D-cysteine desulfhydrase, partial [Methanococcaceae archaeon]
YQNCSFYMKRDDMTGFELSGNKVRKLEYLLRAAQDENASMVYTCGGEQSNHARATAAAAAATGLRSKLFLWGDGTPPIEGNLFIDKFLNAEIQYLNAEEYNDVNNIMKASAFSAQQNGARIYTIPEGGSSALGIWGYIGFYEELNQQIQLNKLKGILTACGSGGTSAGLLLGASLHNLNIKIFAVNVLYKAEEIKERIISLAHKCIEKFEIPCKLDESKLEIVDGYSDEGYKNIETSKLHEIKSFALSTGIILDPAYTGKAFCAYKDYFLKNSTESSILFIHTGGFFGIFDKKDQYLIQS